MLFSISSRSIIFCFRVGDCCRHVRLLKCDEEVRQTIQIHCTGVNMDTCVTFICLKQAYEKLQVFDGIFSKGGTRKSRNMAKQNRRDMAGLGEVEGNLKVKSFEM